MFIFLPLAYVLTPAPYTGHSTLHTLPLTHPDT